MSNRFEFISENSVTAGEKHAERSKALAHAARASYRERLLRSQAPAPTPTSIPAPLPPAGAEAQPLLSPQKTKQASHRTWLARQANSFHKSGSPLTPSRSIPRNLLDHCTAASLPLSRQARQICDFIKSTWIPGHLIDLSQSPWLKFSMIDIILSETVRNLSRSETSAAEALPYLPMFSRLAGPDASRKWCISALKEKNKVIAMVRRSAAKLENSTVPGGELSKPGSSNDLIVLIAKLFVAAVCSNQFEEARLHAETLQRLLKRKIGNEGEVCFMCGALAYIVQHDAQLSQMMMQRTVFDLDFWAAWIEREIVIARCFPVDAYLRARHKVFEANLDPALGQNGLLREVCRDIRIYLWLWRLEGPISKDVNGRSIAYYLVWWYSYSLGRLSNYHLEMREKLMANHGHDATLGNHIQAILAVSLMLYVATFAGNPRIGGVDLWPKVDMFLQHLRSYIESFNAALLELEEPAVEFSKWQRQVLYAYWVGATWEQRRTTETSSFTSTWFKTGFFHLARGMGLESWSDIRQVVDGFSDHRFAKPGGEVWVDRSLREGLG